MFFSKTIRPESVNKFIASWPIDQTDWVALSINATNFEFTEQNLQIESHFKNDQYMLQLGKKEKNYQINLVNNGKIAKKGKAAKDSPGLPPCLKSIKSITNLHLKRVRELLITWSRTDIILNNAKELDASVRAQEEKTLEWFRVSFIVLRKALEDLLSLKSADLVEHEGKTIQAMIFCGEKEGQFKFKLRIYNLDIEIKNVGTHYNLIVFDKKAKEDFSPEDLVLNSPIHTLTNPILDEIIKILPLIETSVATRVL